MAANPKACRIDCASPEQTDRTLNSSTNTARMSKLERSSGKKPTLSNGPPASYMSTFMLKPAKKCQWNIIPSPIDLAFVQSVRPRIASKPIPLGEQIPAPGRPRSASPTLPQQAIALSKPNSLLSALSPNVFPIRTGKLYLNGAQVDNIDVPQSANSVRQKRLREFATIPEQQQATISPASSPTRIAIIDETHWASRGIASMPESRIASKISSPKASVPTPSREMPISHQRPFTFHKIEFDKTTLKATSSNSNYQCSAPSPMATNSAAALQAPCAPQPIWRCADCSRVFNAAQSFIAHRWEHSKHDTERTCKQHAEQMIEAAQIMMELRQPSSPIEAQSSEE